MKGRMGQLLSNLFELALNWIAYLSNMFVQTVLLRPATKVASIHAAAHSDQEERSAFDSRLYENEDKRLMPLKKRQLTLSCRDESSADDWFFRLKEVHRAVELNTNSFEPIKVAIIDTGVNIRHPKISNAFNMGAITDDCCQSFPGRLDPKADFDGHGTHVASVLLRTAPNVSLYIARVADDEGIIVGGPDYEGVAHVRTHILQKSAKSCRP